MYLHLHEQNGKENNKEMHLQVQTLIYSHTHTNPS